MKVLGDPKAESEQGSFFLPEDSPDQLWYHFSKRFLEQHEDFFLNPDEMSAAVLQFSYDVHDEVVAHDDDNATTKPKTLQFLATDQDTYYWQLTEAHEEGRDQLVIGVGRKALAGELTVFDVQGRQSDGEALSPEYILAVFGIVKTVVESAQYKSRLNDFLRRKAAVIQSIRDFEAEEKKRYTPEKLQKLLDEKREALKHVGFQSLGIHPIDLPMTPYEQTGD